MSSKVFNSLIGRDSDTSHQRMPEEIKAGDSILLDHGAGSSAVFVVKGAVEDATVADADLGILTAKIASLSNHDTDELAEGAGNLYFTVQRARAAIVQPQISFLAATNGTQSFTYDDASGQFSLDLRTDQSIRDLISQNETGDLSISDNADDLAAFGWDPATGELSFSSADVSDVRGLISAAADDGLSYVANTGALSLAQSIKTDASPTFAGMTLDGPAGAAGLLVGTSGAQQSVIIHGNLTVTGTSVTANSETVLFKDNILALNHAVDEQGNIVPNVSPAISGLRVELADDQLPNDRDAGWLYVSADDRWKAIGLVDGTDSTGELLDIQAAMFHGDLTGDVTGTVSDISNHDTDALAEGSSNLYFTQARARASVGEADDGVVVYDVNSGKFDVRLKDIPSPQSLYLAMQKLQNGDDHEIATPFAVAMEAAPQGVIGSTSKTDEVYGSISFSGTTAGGNVVTLDRVKRSDIQADFEALVDGAASAGGFMYDAAGGFEMKLANVAPSGTPSAGGSFGYAKLVDGANGFSAEMKVATAAPGAPGLAISDEIITYTPPSDANIRARFGRQDLALTAAPTDPALERVAELTYADGVYTLRSATPSQILNLIPDDSTAVAHIRELLSSTSAGAVQYDNADGEISVHLDNSAAAVSGTETQGFATLTDAASGLSARLSVAVQAAGAPGLLISNDQIQYTPPSDANIRARFSADNGDQVAGEKLDRENAADTDRVAKLVKTDGEYKVESMRRDELVAVGRTSLSLTVSNSAATDKMGSISYAEGTGAFSVDLVEEKDIIGSLTNEQDPTSVSGNIIGVHSASNSALTYEIEGGKGVFKLDSAQELSDVKHDALLPKDADTTAGSDIDAGELVSAGGDLAQADRDDWAMRGVAHEDMDQGDSMAGKVELMAHGSISEVMVKDGESPQAGDWLYLSDTQPGTVQMAMPDTEGKCVVIIGRAIANASAGKVKLCMCPQFLFNC